MATVPETEVWGVDEENGTILWKNNKWRAKMIWLRKNTIFSRLRRRIQRSADWQVLLVLVVIAIGSTLFSGLQNSDQFSAQWWSDFSQNFSTEMFGAFVTFLLLEKVVGSRNAEDRLILQLRSSDNATALNALAELWARGWVRDGTLKRVDLGWANLQTANLSGADLRGANFYEANLQGAKLLNTELQEVDLKVADLKRANLYRANLQRADLRGTKLQEADLEEANLQGANLDDANLQGADLSFVNLQGVRLEGAKLRNAVLIGTNLRNTDLMGADLQGAKLRDVTFDEATVLPDQKPWSENVNMEKFTDPEHPEFWQPYGVDKYKSDE